MPFSEVGKPLRIKEGPVGRFRIMLNGEQIHADGLLRRQPFWRSLFLLPLGAWQFP